MTIGNEVETYLKHAFNSMTLELLAYVSSEIQVPLGEAGNVYRTMKNIIETNTTFISWLERYVPEMVVELPQYSLEDHLRRLSQGVSRDIVA